MRISIIILTFNHEKYICDCLESIKFQQQTYNKDLSRWLQVIIADDCSKDGTVDEVQAWITGNKNVFQDIQLLTSEKNCGTCKNYLRALDKAEGNYVKAIGGDDLFAITSIFDIIGNLNSYDVVYGLPLFYYENGENAFERIFYEKMHCENMRGERRSFYERIHRQCFLNGPATFVRKELLTDVKVREILSEHKYVDDYTTWLKISELKEIKTLYLPEFFIIYRRTQKSAYVVRNDDVQAEVIRSYQYALDTSKGRLDKLFLVNKIKNLKKGRKAFFNLQAYIRNINWLFFRKKYSLPVTTKTYDECIHHIKRITNMNRAE